MQSTRSASMRARRMSPSPDWWEDMLPLARTKPAMPPDGAHGCVHGVADLRAFGEGEQVIEAGVGREIDDAGGVVGRGVIDARAAPAAGGLLLQHGAVFGETGVSEAEEDEAEDGRGILRGFEAGIGAELIGGGPEAFFQGVVGGVLFGGGDPDHKRCHRAALAFVAKRKGVAISESPSNKAA